MSHEAKQDTPVTSTIPPIDEDLLEFDPLATGTIPIEPVTEAPIPTSKSTAVDSLLKEFETQEQQREIEYEERIKSEEEKLGVHL